MKIQSAILAFSCVFCCLLSNSFGQFSRQATRTNSLSRKSSLKITVATTDRQLRLIPQAKELKPDIGGTFIDLGFKTNVNAITLVTLVKVNGPLPPGTESFKWTPAGVQHQVQFVNLEANTDYKIQIDLLPTAPVDGTTPQSTLFPFKTLQRHVFVALEEVFVFDDADDLSAGDLEFGVQIGDGNAVFSQPGNSWDFLKFRTSMNSGTGINLPQTDKPYYLFQNNVQSTTLKIAISANEKDFAFGPHFPFRPSLDDNYLGSGEDSYNEWNSGFKLIDIGHTFLTPNGGNLHQQEALVKDFEIYVPPSSVVDLSYSLSGQLVVAYW